MLQIYVLLSRGLAWCIRSLRCATYAELLSTILLPLRDVNTTQRGSQTKRLPPSGLMMKIFTFLYAKMKIIDNERGENSVRLSAQLQGVCKSFVEVYYVILCFGIKGSCEWFE